MEEDLIIFYNILIKEELMSAWIENPIDWYPVGYMLKSQFKSEK